MLRDLIADQATCPACGNRFRRGLDTCPRCTQRVRPSATRARWGMWLFLAGNLLCLAIAFLSWRAGHVFPTWGRFGAATRWKAVTLLALSLVSAMGLTLCVGLVLLTIGAYWFGGTRFRMNAHEARGCGHFLLYADCLFWTVYAMLFASGWLEFFVL